VDPDEYLSLLNENLVAPVALTKQATPHLRKTKGSVIFVSSIGGERFSKNSYLLNYSREYIVVIH